MDIEVIREGWVEKRSQYLRQWRRRWLVLSSAALQTFKARDTADVPTLYIEADDVLRVIRADHEVQRLYSFKVLTPNQSFFFTVENEQELNDWMRCISQMKQISSEANHKHAVQQFQEMKANTEITLITSFNQIKIDLYEREQELLQELDLQHEMYKKITSKQLQEMDILLSQENENFQKFLEICEGAVEDNVNTIRKAQALPKPQLSFKVFDALVNTQIQASVEEAILSRLISFTTKVVLENPNEIKIRRTSITRALKWRYTGERYDAITFTLNHDIKLSAIGLCRPKKQGNNTTVKEFQVLKGNFTNSTSVYRHPVAVVMNYDSEESVFKLPLARPLPLKKETNYTAIFCIEGSSTFKCVDCYLTVEGPGGVIWNFNKTNFAANHQNNRSDTVCGPIADFYYLNR
jgi:hypothetical protein